MHYRKIALNYIFEFSKMNNYRTKSKKNTIRKDYKQSLALWSGAKRQARPLAVKHSKSISEHGTPAYFCGSNNLILDFILLLQFNDEDLLH